jgi:cytochrome c oxidase subunit IV
MDRPTRKTYLIVFGWLAALTALEVGLVYLPLERAPMASALIALAVAKAGLVALFFMHLRYETRILRRAVLLPLLAPILYGVVLVAEGMARLGA